MSIKLEDYDEALRDTAPEVRDVLEATFQEASRVMSPAGLEEYLDGAKALSNLGRGSGVVTTYLQEIPMVAKECGEDVIPDCLTGAMKLSSMTSGEVIELFFNSMPTAAAATKVGQRLCTIQVFLETGRRHHPRGLLERCFQHITDFGSRIPQGFIVIFELY